MRIFNLTNQLLGASEPIQDGAVGTGWLTPLGVEGQIVKYGPNGRPIASWPTSGDGDGGGFDPAPLIERVDAVEQSLASLPAPAQPYDPAPIVARLDGVEQALEALPAPYDPAPLMEAVEQALSSLPEAYDPAPLVARVEQVEAALEDIPGEYNDAPLVERVEALEGAAPVKLSALVIREDRLIAIMSDGSEVEGPVIVGAAPAPLVAPAFGPGGSLTIDGDVGAFVLGAGEQSTYDTGSTAPVSSIS